MIYHREHEIRKARAAGETIVFFVRFVVSSESWDSNQLPISSPASLC